MGPPAFHERHKTTKTGRALLSRPLRISDEALLRVFETMRFPMVSRLRDNVGELVISLSQETRR